MDRFRYRRRGRSRSGFSGFLGDATRDPRILLTGLKQGKYESAPNKRIDRFDTSAAVFFVRPADPGPRQPDVRRMRRLLAPFPSNNIPLHLDGAHQYLIVNRLHLPRIADTLSLASTRDLIYIVLRRDHELLRQPDSEAHTVVRPLSDAAQAGPDHRCLDEKGAPRARPRSRPLGRARRCRRSDIHLQGLPLVYR